MTNEQTHTTEQLRALAELMQNCIIKDANFYGDLAIHYGKGQLIASGEDALTVGKQIAISKYEYYVTEMTTNEYSGIIITITVKAPEPEAAPEEPTATVDEIIENNLQ